MSHDKGVLGEASCANCASFRIMSARLLCTRDARAGGQAARTCSGGAHRNKGDRSWEAGAGRREGRERPAARACVLLRSAASASPSSAALAPICKPHVVWSVNAPFVLDARQRSTGVSCPLSSLVSRVSCPLSSRVGVLSLALSVFSLSPWQC